MTPSLSTRRSLPSIAPDAKGTTRISIDGATIRVEESLREIATQLHELGVPVPLRRITSPSVPTINHRHAALERTL